MTFDRPTFFCQKKTIWIRHKKKWTMPRNSKYNRPSDFDCRLNVIPPVANNTKQIAHFHFNRSYSSQASQQHDFLPLSIVGVSKEVVITDEGLLFLMRFASFASKKKSWVSVSSWMVVEIGIACCVVNGLRDGRLKICCPIVVCSLSSSGSRVDFSAWGLCRTTLLSASTKKTKKKKKKKKTTESR